MKVVHSIGAALATPGKVTVQRRGKESFTELVKVAIRNIERPKEKIEIKGLDEKSGIFEYAVNVIKSVKLDLEGVRKRAKLGKLSVGEEIAAEELLGVRNDYHGKKVLLVDAHNLFHRSYHGSPEMISEKVGRNVNVLKTLSRMLKGSLADDSLWGVVFCDEGNNLVRTKEFPEYKANRKKPEEDLLWQIQEIRSILLELGVPMLSLEGYEADDLLGSFARYYVERGARVVISSSDKDLSQLLTIEGVEIIDPQKGKKIDREYVLERYGVPPEKFVDYLALVGDTSDNIPGVPGIGPKKAADLLSRYTSVEDIYTHIDQLKGKMKESLAKNRTQALLSKRLAKIETEAPVVIFHPGDASKKPAVSDIDRIFSHYGIK